MLGILNIKKTVEKNLEIIYGIYIRWRKSLKNLTHGEKEATEQTF